MINLENYLSFTDCGINYKYMFGRDLNVDCIDIVVFEPGKLGGSAWIHHIKNDGIIWRQDDWLNITPKAK